MTDHFWFDGLAESEADHYNYWWIDIDLHLRRIAQLQERARAISDTETRWAAYLASLPGRQLVSEEVALSAEQLWFDLAELVGGLTPPDASPTGNGGLLMSWDRNGQHVEIELLPNASYEWFYRERLADITAGGEETDIEVVSPSLRDHLRRVFM